MANNLTAPAGSASSAITPGAIIGDNPVPYGAAMLTAGDSLTTGDLAIGDAGEAGSLLDFSAEVWVRFNAAAAGFNLFIVQGPQSTSGAITQWGIRTGGAGGAQFSAVNAAGTEIFSTQGPAMIAGTWYHLVGVVTGGNIRCYVNGVDAGAAAFVGAIRPASLGAGVSAMNVGYAGGTNMHVDELAVYRTALSSARVTAHYNAGRNRGFSVQGSGERIAAVLDSYSSTAPRSLQAGVRNVIPRYMSGQSPLSEINHAVEAEDVDAVFFTTSDGTLKFLADGHRSSSPYNTSQVTVGDGGGAEIPYTDCQIDYSETWLINEWNVTRTAYQQNIPVTQTALDATSTSRYFKRSQSLSDVPCTTDANCATIASALLAKYKDPIQRVTSVSFKASVPAVSEAVFARELMDCITVKRRPPGGGSPISQVVYIQQIEISGTPHGPLDVKWAVSPL